MQSDPNRTLSQENLPSGFGEVRGAGHLKNIRKARQRHCITAESPMPL
jgi:hypothetical protein